MTKILSDALLRDISNLYDGTDDYDVKIEVGQEVETEIFKAHSVILRARNNFNSSIFTARQFCLISYWINGQEPLLTDLKNKSLKSIILSRVKDSGYAISDDALNKIGFGKGDLYIFLNRCDLQDYTVKILDSKSFEIVDYEVFQVLTK
ncbi:15701_t:CDS:2 [Funneliformis geosporum]|uniref:15701_t:CDS:1 n=1 Tax=Funneliformis geosporum TaxID=1117311 RepID=A0A9W4WP18_9GLOM|nr:15701_t:CDS:2 [Funneliformis geosporum]